MKIPTDYTKLIKLFNKLTGAKSLWQVFTDCIEMYALSIQNRFCFGNQFVCNENRYMDIIKSYPENKTKIITEIFAEIINQLEVNPYQDLLGVLYMRLKMGDEALKQMFTPYSVAYTMAKSTMSKEDAEKAISEKGFVSLLEPTVGGGVNVVAFCEMLNEYGFNYQTQSVVVCQELHRTTAMMCYIVLSLIGCPAIIKVGDSLTNPYTNYYDEVKNNSELWTTPMFHIQNCYDKV